MLSFIRVGTFYMRRIGGRYVRVQIKEVPKMWVKRERKFPEISFIKYLRGFKQIP